MSAEAQVEAFFSPAMKFNLKDHDVTLQTLNREAKGVFLTLESFEPTVGAWAGTPVIKADGHPDMNLFDINPDEALKAVNGTIVGEVAEPHINMTGHPTLESVLSLKDEAGLEALINQGNLSISTGFHCLKQEDFANQYGPAFASTKGPVTPHHVLLFIETPEAKNTPGDKGAVFLNTRDLTELRQQANEFIMMGVRRLNYINDIADSVVTKMTNEITHQEPATPVVETAPPAVDPPPAAPMPAPVAVQAAAETAVLAEEAIAEVITAALPLDLATMGKELAKAMARVKELEALLAEAMATMNTMLADKADDAWREVKEFLPPGMTHKEEDEKKVRAEWEKDPHKVSMTAMTFMATGEVPGEKSGEAFTMGPKPKTAHRATVGVWDAKKSEFVDAL